MRSKIIATLTLTFAFVSCHPPMVAHRDTIRVTAKIPAQGVSVKGELCMTIHYEYTQSSRENSPQEKALGKRNVCQAASADKDGVIYFETSAEHYVPYRTVTMVAAENIVFRATLADAQMEDYDIQHVYAGKLLSFKKESSILDLNLEFALSKKIPVSKLATIVNACQLHVDSRNVDACVKWRIEPPIAESCGRIYSTHEQYACLKQAAIQQGTFVY